MQKLKKKMCDVLEATPAGGRLGEAVNVSIIVLIFLNVIAVMAGASKFSKFEQQKYYNAFETLSVIVFTIEYLLSTDFYNYGYV